MVLVVETPARLLQLVGTRLGPTRWIGVDQGRVDAFADITGDRQWIHVDVERAKSGPFGGTIVHGYLTMSLVNLFLPELIEVQGFAHAVNVGLDRLRFLSPVLVGSRLRAVGEIVAAEELKGGIQSVVQVIVEIENPDGTSTDRPALTADTISRYFPG